MFRTIKNKFLLNYVSVMVVAIVILTVVFSYVSAYHYEGAIEDHLMSETQLHASTIDEILHYHIAVLQEKTTQEAIYLYDIDEMNQDLRSIMASNNYLFEHVFYVSESGQSYRMTGEIGDVGDRDYYRVHLEHELDYYIGEPLVGRTLGVPVFHISVPIRTNEFKGMIVGSIPLGRLAEELEDKKLTGDSFGWILDQEGNFIVHPVFSFDEGVNLQKIANANNDGEPIIPLPLLLDEGIGEFRKQADGKTYNVAFTKIENSPGWKLGLVYEKRSIVADRLGFKIVLIVLTLAIILLVILVTRLLTSSVVKPIELLTQSAINEEPLIGELNGLQKSDEMASLIESYNKMHESIKNNTQNLEHLVEEKTAALKAANDELYNLAIRDHLTGLLNRSELDDALQDLKDEVDSRKMASFTILFADLNNFKYYNDQYGHEVGDLLLIEISKLLLTSLSSEDLVFRYGGDEFVMVLPNVGHDLAEKIKNRLLDALGAKDSYRIQLSKWLEGQEIDIPPNKVLGLSIGEVVYDQAMDMNVSDLIKYADEAMYTVKKNSKKNNKKE